MKRGRGSGLLNDRESRKRSRRTAASDGMESEREEELMRSRNRGEEEEDEACDEGWRQRLWQRLRQRLWDLAGVEEEKMGGEEANGEVRQRRPSWVGEDVHSGEREEKGSGRQCWQRQHMSMEGGEEKKRGGDDGGAQDHNDGEGEKTEKKRGEKGRWCGR